MRNILSVIFFVLAGNAFASDVYYCSDAAVAGIEPKENNQIGPYKGERFKLSIDWIAPKVLGEDILFTDNLQQQCFTQYDGGLVIYCATEIGYLFNIHQGTLKYNRAATFNLHGLRGRGDTLLVATGTCEKF